MKNQWTGATIKTQKLHKRNWNLISNHW